MTFQVWGVGGVLWATEVTERVTVGMKGCIHVSNCGFVNCILFLFLYSWEYPVLEGKRKSRVLRPSMNHLIIMPSWLSQTLVMLLSHFLRIPNYLRLASIHSLKEITTRWRKFLRLEGILADRESCESLVGLHGLLVSLIYKCMRYSSDEKWREFREMFVTYIYGSRYHIKKQVANSLSYCRTRTCSFVRRLRIARVFFTLRSTGR